MNILNVCGLLSLMLPSSLRRMIYYWKLKKKNKHEWLEIFFFFQINLRFTIQFLLYLVYIFFFLWRKKSKENRSKSIVRERNRERWWFVWRLNISNSFAIHFRSILTPSKEWKRRSEKEARQKNCEKYGLVSVQTTALCYCISMQSWGLIAWKSV